MTVATKEISVDTAVAVVLSELDGIFALKDEQRTAQKAFLGGEGVFSLRLTGFGKSLVEHTGQ